MKKAMLYLAMIAVVISCKKKEEEKEDENPTNNTPSVTCKLKYSTSNNGNDSTVYVLNASNQPTEVNTFQKGNTTKSYWEVGTYTNGKLTKIQEFNSSAPTVARKTSVLTYTGNNVTQVVESGKTNGGSPYSVTYTFTYNSSNQITNMTTSGDVDELDGPQGMENIVYSGGNFVTADLVFATSPTKVLLPVNIKSDTKKKLARFQLNSGFDIVMNTNQNNMYLATAAAALPVASIALGDTLFYTKLFYNSNSEVTRTEEKNDDGSKRIEEFVWECK